MITLVLVIPTTLICAFYYRGFEQSLIQEAEDSLRESLEGISGIIEGNLELAETVMKEIAYSQELVYFLDRESCPSEGEMHIFLQNIQEEWLYIRHAYPNMFSQMNLYMDNPQRGTGNSWKINLYDLDRFKGPDASGKAGQDIFFGKIGEGNRSSGGNGKDFEIANGAARTLPIYMNVRNIRTDEVVGVVELDMPVEKLVDSRTVKSTLGEMAFLLLDEEENVLYQSGEIEDITAVRKCSKAFEQIDAQGMVTISEEAVIGAARNMIWKVCLVAVAGVLCMMLLTYLIIRGMLNRLVVMDEVMGRVETGDFQVEIEDDGYNDEISRTKRRFNQMTRQLQSVIRQMLEKERVQKEAELRALQAQINPHFLFNTLESMRMQCEYDRYYKIADKLLALGEIFRYTIKWGSYEVPFSLEWNNLKNYISIMNLRLDDDFSSQLEYDEAVGEVMVPKMLLQPIVENSFRHGFKGKPAPWFLYVSAKRETSGLRIVIEDNGCGVGEEKLAALRESMEKRCPAQPQEGHQSIGILNVLQRIDRICAQGSGMTIENRPEGGIRIVIIIATEAEHVSDISG